MKLIKGFEINTNDLPAVSESRSFKITGDDGAVFSFQVKASDGRYYNFVSKTFSSTVTSESRLTNKEIIGQTYTGEVFFPADVDGETYTILLQAEPHFDTKIMEGLFGVGFEYNSVLYQDNITQVADVVVTFQPTAATAADYTSASLSQTTTVTQSPTVASPPTTTISWTVANAASDAKGFGLITVGTAKRKASDASQGSEVAIDDNSWQASTTAVINDSRSDDGGGSTHYNYFVDSVADLSIGMTITAISSGTLGSPPTLTEVGKRSGTITDVAARNKEFIKMNGLKAFADGITLTLKGYGVNDINKATGCDVVLSDFKLTQTPLSTTVRDAVSATTAITVNGTFGISKGAFFEGFGVDNSISNPITAVPTPSSSAGIITATTEQTLADDTKLNIIGSSSSFTITGTLTINKMPSSNTTIYLDLDKILTLGTAS